MSSRHITYYFTLLSPWAYLGHAQFIALAGRHALQVDYRPVGLGQIFPETGGLPLAKRHPARQNYRMMELQRWRDKRNVPITLRPKYFPCDIALADKLLIAILAAGLDPEAFVPKVFAALWVEDRDPADEAVLADILHAAGLDADRLMAAAQSPASAETYQANIRQALATGVFGSPSYVWQGEIFWGQDRLEILGDALASGRARYLG